MQYEVYTRVMVGVPLDAEGVAATRAGFHGSLGLEVDAPLDAVQAALVEAAPRHKRGGDPRARYELALEAWLDARWDVDFALSGVSDGGLDPARCMVWVGVRIEQWEGPAKVEMPAAFVRPRTLRKGDLSPGSDLARELGGEARKEFQHAVRMYQRARLQIEGDALTRTRGLPVSHHHDVGWWLLRWIVPRV